MLPETADSRGMCKEDGRVPMAKVMKQRSSHKNSITANDYVMRGLSAGSDAKAVLRYSTVFYSRWTKKHYLSRRGLQFTKLSVHLSSFMNLQSFYYILIKIWNCERAKLLANVD